MTSRDTILAKVRAGLGKDAKTPSDDRSAAVDQRLAARERHLIPARVAGKGEAELAPLLRRWLEAAAGELIEVPAERDVPGAVAKYLREHNLPARLRAGDDAYLGALPWSTEPTLQLEHGRASPDDQVGLTHALAAVAETGTLVVPSGAANPVTLSFLPETNIVVVRRADVVGPLEEAWTRARGAGPAGGLPRTVNLISGPSRSADIGGIPVLGAHGPRRLCVIVVG